MPLPVPASLPVEGGRIISRQGPRPSRRTWHNGIDVVFVDENDHAIADVPVRAVAAGTVESVNACAYDCSYGSQVVIRHEDGLLSVYAHLNRIDVEAGQEVEAGQQIGLVGDTTNLRSDMIPHLHLELVKSWPLGPNNYTARWDVLHELAAAGVVLDGEQLVLGDPTEYSEPMLADVKMPPGEGWREVVAPLESASPRRHLGYGPAIFLGGLLFVTVGSILYAVWRRQARRSSGLGGTGRRGPRRKYSVKVFDPSTGTTERWSEGVSRTAAERLEARLRRDLLWDERNQVWYRLRPTVVED